MTVRHHVGIDPGVSGAVVLLSDQGRKVEKVLNAATLGDRVSFLRSVPRGLVFAAVEEVPTAIFGAGKSSCSKLYGSYRELLAVLLTLGLRHETVRPVVWQRGVGVSARKKGETNTAWKNRLKAKAQALFPSEKVTLATADALLIAEYARRKFG